MKKRLFLALAAFSLLASANADASAGKDLYLKHCAECHHDERYGLSGPPLIPEYLGYKKEKEITAIINSGLKATNMPGFAEKLKAEEVKAVVDFITSPAVSPKWGREEMLETWELSAFSDDKKTPKYDMTNFFMVVEGGAGRVHFMDGDSFAVLDNVRAGAIHGGPKFDSDIRYAYIASRDGWVIKYDLVNLREGGRIRAGISSRNLAVSANGRYLAVATLLPDALVIIDSLTMKPVKTITGEGSFGAVYTLKSRGEFVVAYKDKPGVMTISDKTFEVRAMKTGEPFTDFFIDPKEKYLVGTARNGAQINVLDLDKGEVVKSVKSDTAMPHLASAAVWSDDSGTYAAFPHIGKPLVSVLELYRWETKGSVPVKGPGFFARTLDAMPHIWVDTGTDTIQLIDKKTLKVEKELTPEKGKKAMHIEFNKDGSAALISVWEEEGAVKIYDSKTLELKKTLPFRKPVGKYNATNKKH